MSSFKKWVLTLLLLLLALILTFVVHLPQLAYLLVASLGGLMALTMLVDMIGSLRQGRYGVDLLAITAIIATLVVGDYWSSLIILIMLTGGESLEAYAIKQSSRDLEALLAKNPKSAHHLQAGGVQEVAVDSLQVGDRILVKPDEMVPVDGLVCDGSSLCDESSLTGESLPVAKTIGDQISSGTINGSYALTLQVQATAKDSQYQQLLTLIETAKASPAPFVRLADRYALPFTLFAYLLGGLAWYLSKDPVRFAQVLVVASPCPLILAAPIALVAGMSQASKKGIIVKTGAILETCSQLKTFAFDKTGTLTQGRLVVADIVPLTKLSQQELVTLAASLEQQSSHVIAQTLVAYAKSQGYPLYPVTGVHELTAQGVTGFIGQDQLTVGKASLFAQALPQAQTTETVVYIGRNQTCLGYITFRDQLRPEARNTLTTLKHLGVERLLMLTGDKQAVASKVGKDLGLTEIYAQCLPQDKLAHLSAIPSTQRPLAMVGDGVNDAPALVQADVGIAMGDSKTTLASEHADVIILRDDLSKVASLLAIAQHTLAIARQSVLLGLVTCLVLMCLAALGWIPTFLGAILQEVIDVIAILSALRARRVSDKT